MAIRLLDNFVSVSEFSQGKANRIFKDVAENNAEYVVVKNNKPTAVVLSVEEYQNTKDTVERLETYIKELEKKFSEEKFSKENG